MGKSTGQADQAAELRGAIARSGHRIYQVAAASGIHPSRLSLMLHNRIPLRADVVAKILKVIEAGQ